MAGHSTEGSPWDLSAADLAELLARLPHELRVVSPAPSAAASAPVAEQPERPTPHTERTVLVYVDGVGWRRLNPATESGATVLAILARRALAADAAAKSPRSPFAALTAMFIRP